MLVQELKKLYIKKGYPTTQVKVVVGQSLQEGMLKILIINGFIEKIQLNKNTLRDKGKIATAFPFLKNKLLYLKRLEQGIDQINARTSSHAVLKILPGLQEGGSIIQIDHIVMNPFRVDIGSDNLGEATTGKWRGKVNLSLDNLLSINDNLTVHYIDNQVNKLANHKTNNYSLVMSCSFPLGYYTLTTSHHIGSSGVPVKTRQYTSLHINKSSQHNYDIQQIIYKTKLHKTSLGIGLSHRTNANYLRDVKIENQSGRYTNIKIGTHATGVLFNGQYDMSITYHQGVTWLGAKQDNQPKQPDVPQAQFKKISCHWLWMYPFFLFKQYCTYQLSFSSQYSKDELFSSDQFSIAGLEQVRGVQGNYSGNSGVCLKQEIAMHSLFSFNSWLSPFQLLTGLDIGYLPQVSSMDPRIGNKSANLVSWACGCKYNASWLSTELIYAKPLQTLSTSENNNYKIYCSMVVRLHNLLKIIPKKRERGI